MAAELSVQTALNQATASVNEINQILKSSNITQDPFAPTAPVSAPDALNAPRKALANAAAQLLALATDPKEYLDNLAMNYQNLVCLRWLVNLEIVPQIPTTGSISYSELAEKARVPENQLKAIARMAQTHGFLYEPEPDKVCHSRISALLVKDNKFLEWAKWMTNYSVPTAYKLPEATQKWGKTEKKDETAFNVGMTVDVPFFDHLRENKEMNTLFSSYMRNVASTEGISFTHLINGFDWKSLPAGATVVDVGGSTGHASIALAQAYPHLNFIVEDLPETIANSKKAFESHPAKAEVGSRLRFQEHDFFKPQPVTDGDIYLLRMIIHDWPDSEAIKILGHIQAGLQKPGARVIIMDTILPEPGSIPVLQERQLRVRDLTMIQVFNAKERELEDWKQLTSKVGLQVQNSTQPSGSVMGVLTVGLKAGATPSPSNGVNGTGVASKTVNGTNGILPPRDSSKKLPVLVVGGGIGGLLLAQGLKKNGVDFLVFERDLTEDWRPQGYRLKLEDDAAAALKESLPQDVYDQFQVSCAISTVGETDYDPISGQIIKSRSGGGLAVGGLRASYTVDRAVFRNQLMKGIEDNIVYAKEIVSYTADEENSHVVATFKDGTTYEGSFIVGADGRSSTVRKQMLPDHRYVDTGAICIYGKTEMTPDLLMRFPARGLRWMTAASDHAPLIQSILIGDSPLTLLSEPIRFEPKSRSQISNLPADYVYWVLIGRKEIFAAPGSRVDLAEKEAANLSLELTKEWDPSIRSLFELQDVRQASTFRVVSATPEAPGWKPSKVVTLIGDAIHAMSPCGGVGANTALRDAAELAKTIAGAGKEPVTAESIGAFEKDMKIRTIRSLMRSYAGSKAMFDQKPYKECEVLDF
ncbi:O-methyltransferase-like protein 7 [Elsinoe australis]|uniref:O-methyltransferase-like protein 7 n=1 Tax=Elsinoe australis TaxID=40998 RepID=A0A4U7B7M1_9PEZI|nr:O-methyltransferase-like protein 7 [Elsinoe australis]